MFTEVNRMDQELDNSFYLMGSQKGKNEEKDEEYDEDDIIDMMFPDDRDEWDNE